MKCSSNRSGHAAMLRLKARKGFQGQRIADHTRDLSAPSGIGRLPLRSRFSAHKSRGKGGVSGADLFAGEHFAIMYGFIARKAVKHRGLAKLADCGGGGFCTRLRAADVIGASGDCGDFRDVHFTSPKRANPADKPSLHVTSDASTTVRRLFTTACRPRP